MWAFPLLPFRSRTEVQFQSLRAKGAWTYWPHVTCPAKRQIPIGQPFILPYRCCLMLLLRLLLLHPFNGLFSRTTWVSRHQKGKTSEDLNEARDYGVWGCSGISWTIRKQYAPRARQTTTPAPHHSISTGRMVNSVKALLSYGTD